MRLPNMDTLSCCCGRAQCAYLKHNNAALEGLESDLRSAAQIGQVRSFSTSSYDVTSRPF